MFFKYSGLKLITAFFLLCLISCSSGVRQSVIFDDQFASLPEGEISANVSLKPYYYLADATGEKGNWKVATTLRSEGFSNAWKIVNDSTGKHLAQSFKNINQNFDPISLITHPIIVAGDELWGDYSVEFSFSPMYSMDKCGIVFRFQDERNFYFFGMEGNTIMLKQIHQSTAPRRPLERILAVRPFVWQPGEKYNGAVTLRANKISARIDTISFHAQDDIFSNGRIGILSDIPAKFYSVEVKSLNSEQRKFNRKVRQLDRTIEQNISSNPYPVVWKRLDINQLGGDVNVKFGDLTGDGEKEVVLVQSKISSGGINEIACITAMNLKGEVLWQYDEPGEDFIHLSNEIPLQIHDLDGDGSREIIFVNRGRLFALEGKTGKIERQVKLEKGFEPEALLFTDLLGTGRDNSIILCDRSSSIKALNEKFKILWERETKSGSQPVAIDMDGDLKDEILFGFNTIGSDGELITDLGSSIGDVCNGVAVTEVIHNEIEEQRIVYAAGDWGLLYFNFEGELIKQHASGHVAYFSIADYDLENEGLEIVASNTWGGPGVIQFIDAAGELVLKYNSNTMGTTCQPVNWKGDGEEFFMMNASYKKGGLFSGKGLKEVEFPDDGHPDLCVAVQDFTGDPRDEIIVWDHSQLWIYTQDNNPRAGNTYNPKRISLYNFSANQMHRSLSNW